MKNILVFNGRSPETEHATELALLLAGATRVRLLVWNTIDSAEKPAANKMVAAGHNEPVEEFHAGQNDWLDKLQLKLYRHTGLKPDVGFIHRADCASGNILAAVKKFNIGLLVKGVAGDADRASRIDRDALGCSTSSGCPVLLVPQRSPCRAPEKIVYATDLRFCRQDVVRFLSKIATALNASILIANMAAKGLPHMEDEYALSVFRDVLVHPSNYEHIYFNNIRERDIPKAIDVLVNDMKNDLLVVVNHKYHFNELLGRDTPYVIPEYISVPILIFPS